MSSLDDAPVPDAASDPTDPEQAAAAGAAAAPGAADDPDAGPGTAGAAGTDLPLDAAEADVLEQRLAVPRDDDEYR